MDKDIMDMATMGVAGLAGVVTVITAAVKSAFVVPQAHEAVVTRFGKYSKTAQPGLNFKVPFIDEAKNVSKKLQEKAAEIEVRTKDNVFVKLPVNIQFKVEDAQAWVFKSENPTHNMSSLVENGLRIHGSEKTLDQLYEAGTELEKAVVGEVKDFSDNYGFNVSRIVVNQPKPPEEIKKAFNNVLASKRDLEAADNNAKAEKARIVGRAEADKESMKLNGEGIANQREAIAKGIAESTKSMTDAGYSNEQAMMMMLVSNMQNTISEAGNKGNIIIASGSVGDMMAQYSGVQTMFDKMKKDAPQAP